MMIRNAFRRIPLILLAIAAASPASTLTAPLPLDVEMTVQIPPEVRMRKMHLVRPDLIPYPIAFEVIC
jgi:hypothetical protein